MNPSGNASSDLFGSTDLERMPMKDAEVLFAPRIALPVDSSQLLRSLIEQTPWRSEKVTVWGKSYVQPRLIAWYGDPGRTYQYSGVHLAPLPWTPELLEVKAAVEQAAMETFNSVLLNFYRDGRDSIGFHSDDEPELGPRPVIASLSLGEERTFIFKHRNASTIKPVKLQLPSASLLVMKGDTQANWKHGIDKENRHVGPRVNLTFRRILP